MRLDNLALNTSYDVTVSIVNALQLYRSLPDMNTARTLPSKTHKPQVIPEESIKLRNFTISENPMLLNVDIEWEPAEGMRLMICKKTV